jgi:hypothetical protein
MGLGQRQERGDLESEKSERKNRKWKSEENGTVKRMEK